MTLLLNNEEVEKALTPAGTIEATENVYRELAEGAAYNRARSQVYLPVESKANPGFRYRFKSQEGGSPGTGVWALRITSDMAGDPLGARVQRRGNFSGGAGDRLFRVGNLVSLEPVKPLGVIAHRGHL